MKTTIGQLTASHIGTTIRIPDLHKPGTDWDAPKVTVTGHLVGMHAAGSRKGWVWLNLTPKGQLDTPLPLDHPCYIPEETRGRLTPIDATHVLVEPEASPEESK